MRVRVYRNCVRARHGKQTTVTRVFLFSRKTVTFPDSAETYNCFALFLARSDPESEVQSSAKLEEMSGSDC